jgi:hypothetical protein
VLDFQVDKQARLNQLPATVSLRRRQLALLGGSTLPTDAATAIPAEAAAAAAVAAAAAGEDQAIDGAANAVADGAAANASLQQLDLSDALVFSSLELERLQQRMQVGGAGGIACLHQDWGRPRESFVPVAFGTAEYESTTVPPTAACSGRHTVSAPACFSAPCHTTLCKCHVSHVSHALCCCMCAGAGPGA